MPKLPPKPTAEAFRLSQRFINASANVKRWCYPIYAIYGIFRLSHCLTLAYAKYCLILTQNHYIKEVLY